MDARLAQSNREALLTLALYVFFAVWWCAFAFAPGADDPETYSYVLGLPAWFFYSCVLGYVLITVMLWLVLRLGFRDMSLDDEEILDPASADSAPNSLAGGTAESDNVAPHSVAPHTVTPQRVASEPGTADQLTSKQVAAGHGVSDFGVPGDTGSTSSLPTDHDPRACEAPRHTPDRVEPETRS